MSHSEKYAVSAKQLNASRNKVAKLITKRDDLVVQRDWATN